MLRNACILDKFYLSLEYILNVYSLSRRNTGLIITCYLGANLQKVSQTIDISNQNMRNNR